MDTACSSQARTIHHTPRAKIRKGVSEITGVWPGLIAPEPENPKNW